MCLTDISEGLDGRAAEVYWPSDQFWHIIRISNVDTQELIAQVSLNVSLNGFAMGLFASSPLTRGRPSMGMCKTRMC